MRSNHYSVYLLPIICHSPTSRPYLPLWLDNGYNNAICHLFYIFFLEVYLVFDISILDRNSSDSLNPTNVLKFLVALSLSVIAFLLISPVTPHPSCFRCCSSINSKCVRQKLYVLLYDCVYNMAIGSVSAPMCVLTFNFHVPFILFRLVPFLFPPFHILVSVITVAASFPHSRVKCSFSIIYYYCTVFVLSQHAFFLLICVVCHVQR